MENIKAPQLMQLKSILQHWKNMSAYNRCETMEIVDATAIGSLLELSMKAMVDYRQFIMEEPLLDNMDAALFYKFRMCQSFRAIRSTFDSYTPNEKTCCVAEIVEKELNDIFAQIVITDAILMDIDNAIEKAKKIATCDIMTTVFKARAAGLSPAQILALVTALGDPSMVEEMLKKI